VRVSRVTYIRLRAVVPLSVAVTNRDEHRHLTSLLSDTDSGLPFTGDYRFLTSHTRRIHRWQVLGPSQTPFARRPVSPVSSLLRPRRRESHPGGSPLW
jgi:hypothetical protein